MFETFDELLKGNTTNAPRVSAAMAESRNNFIAAMMTAKGAMNTQGGEFANFPPAVLNAIASVSKMLHDYEECYEKIIVEAELTQKRLTTLETARLSETFDRPRAQNESQGAKEYNP